MLNLNDTHLAALIAKPYLFPNYGNKLVPLIKPKPTVWLIPHYGAPMTTL